MTPFRTPFPLTPDIRRAINHGSNNGLPCSPHNPQSQQACVRRLAYNARYIPRSSCCTRYVSTFPHVHLDVANLLFTASPHLSWIIIDCEHGLIPLTPTAAESISVIQASANAPSAVIRIPATGVTTSTSWQIKYALDAGARGVLVPMVRGSRLRHRLHLSTTCIWRLT